MLFDLEREKKDIVFLFFFYEFDTIFRKDLSTHDVKFGESWDRGL